MKVEQSIWSGAEGWSGSEGSARAQLVLAFAGAEALRRGALEGVRARWPQALVVGCSTAGEIAGTRVYDDALVATAIGFDRVGVRVVAESLERREQSRAVGARLAERLCGDDLAHVVVLSDGMVVNGSELAKGLVDGLSEGVAVTGGLSGDGARFERTFVVLDGAPREHVVAAIGFYGAALRVGYGSKGGWQPFGPERLVTRSEGSVVYELDGRPALALYKEYLGAHAAGLPAAALRFPLSLRADRPGDRLVRTPLGVDEARGALVFAGDVPEGSYARFKMASVDRLVDGASGAARDALRGTARGTELALLISCVGRKLVLKQRVEEEVDAVREVLGPTPTLAGFYSYGEICPSAAGAASELHNQTMTITTFGEGDEER